MNEIKQHETDKTCNACGSPVVVEWGRYRCSDHQCITNARYAVKEPHPILQEQFPRVAER